MARVRSSCVPTGGPFDRSGIAARQRGTGAARVGPHGIISCGPRPIGQSARSHGIRQARAGRFPPPHRRSSTMRFLKAVIGAIVIIGAGVLGLTLSDRLLAAPDTQVRGGDGVRAPVPVETVPVRLERFVDSVRAVGTARARRAVDLMPEASGRITRIGFRPGARVEQGAVLLELDDRAQQADLAAAEATLAEAEAAFDRQEQLNRTGNASDAAFQTARAALLRAEAERDRAQVQLDDRRLRAPFAGVIGLTDLVEGQMLDSGTPIASLDDLDMIEVDFAVPEQLLPRLAEEQEVRLRSSAWPDRVFQARLSLIDTRVDAATRSIALRAEMPNADRALAGGMFLQVELVLDQGDRPAVPEASISVEGPVHRVLVLQDGQAAWAEIEVGQQADGLIEVLGGIEVGTQIIVSNLHRVEPGTAVEATPRVDRTAVAQPGTGG
ncbi:efflux RND transporter periplasmic adaptor subunit [Paracoccus liaowanqingii]|uniref:Efflux RND transporter periplasmic adaptor subunit n=2 Tax=Paracoccus liaowanqingii TaxID=2560053 RepID=A0A4P7HKX8_9RHOB|nr:efflux RND transporter periplasmic adaptor subunit [Paracoccus liaowanqingii]